MSESPAAKPRRAIRILPPHVINRIAAGEVVERPASVIKELVENALDAGATRIEISAQAGGRNLSIADNGSGMTPEDAALAFINHATSKIDADSNLDSIETLGFRGEALASISAISRLTCFTRTAEASTGSKITFNEAFEPVITEAGCAIGTIMDIADLFYNTPARLKFLKRPQTELGHIEETVQNLALSHPDVKFTLTVNDQTQVKTQGNGQLLSTISDVLKLSRNDIGQMIAVTHEDDTAGISLAGYVSSPSHPKSSKRWLITFVNGRLVKCAVLAKAIETAYTSLIPHGKYPIAVLFLNMPPEEVDVNVHPTKREVRYANGQEIFAFVQHSVRQALEQNGHAAFFGGSPFATESVQTEPIEASLNLNNEESTFSQARSPGNLGYTNPNPHLSPSIQKLASTGSNLGGQGKHSGHAHPWPTQSRLSFSAETHLETPLDTPTAPTVAGSRPGFVQSGFKVIGQLFNTYILLETPQGLMVVDQHIASERYYFEKLTRTTMDTPDETVQQLIGVKPMGISPLQADLLQNNPEPFQQLGFAFTVDAQALTVSLTSIPVLYHDRQPTDLFENLLAQLEETGQMRLDMDLLIATLACHTAVRAGDILSHSDMEAVISQWLGCKLPWTCPHGRPIAHTIQTSQLNDFFERPSLPVNAQVSNAT